MKKNLIILICVIVLLLIAGNSNAQIPGIINFQAKITDNAGDPLNGVYSFNFAIVNQSDTTLWSADNIQINVDEGLYSIKLGDTALGMSPIPSSIFDENDETLLRIWVDGEQLSDQPILPVAYAHKAENSRDSENWSGNNYPGGTIWTSNNDGSGSGLDADMLDGMDSSEIGGQMIYDAIIDASGNGDYTDIGSAIADGKKKLFIKEGTYTLAADITLPDGTLLQGADWNSTEVTDNYKVNGGSNTVIKDMKFTNTGWPGGLQITGSHNFFEHIKIDVLAGYGINSGSYSTIVNCHIVSDAWPVYTGNNSIIRDNYLDGRSGTECNIGVNSLITGNEIHKSGNINNAAIYAGENCAIINNRIISIVTQSVGISADTRARIIGNYIEQFSTGICLSADDGGSIIQGNIVKDCGGTAYYISAPSSQNYVEVIGNVAYNPGGKGFDLQWGRRVMVNGNQVYNAGSDGFYVVTGVVEELTISNNAARNCTGVGFNFSGGSYIHGKWNIVGNQAVSNGSDGFCMYANDSSISGNIAMSNSGIGFNFPNSLKYSSFTGNTASYNGSYGFYATGSPAISECSICSNVIRETFYISGQLHYSTIVGNVLPAGGNNFGSPQTNSVIANNVQ